MQQLESLPEPGSMTTSAGLSTLHWLPIEYRIDFKILLITYKALNGLAPQYLSELLSHYSPPRPLRPKTGTTYPTLFGRQTHSVSLNLD